MPLASPFVATLLDGSGGPVKEKTIFFVISGTGRYYSLTDITDVNGQAVFRPAFVPLPQGLYNVAAYFSGPIPQPNGTTASLADPLYLSSSGSAQLTVASEVSTVTYTGQTIAQFGTALAVTATASLLPDSKGDINLLNVEYKVKQGTTVVQTVVAGRGNGMWPATITGLASGVYSIESRAVGGVFANPPDTTQTLAGTPGEFFTSPTDVALISVYDPTTFVTGGGSITGPTTARSASRTSEV